MIWVNFKIYKETFGEGALKLAEICQKVSQKTKVKIVPVVSPFDLREIKEKIGGEVWLQHVDPLFEGKKTGWISPFQAIAAGADGTLLNHSERRLPPGQISQTLAYLKKEKWQEDGEKTGVSSKGFKTMVCFSTKGQAKSWVGKLSPPPDFFAYEPKELIGGDISVSEAKPEMIKRIGEILKGKELIVGAGVHSKKDVDSALKLGAKGILVSSDIVIAKNPEKELIELAEAFGKK